MPTCPKQAGGLQPEVNSSPKAAELLTSPFVMNVASAVWKSNCPYKLLTLRPSRTTSSPSPPPTHKGASSSTVWVSKSRNLICNDYSLSQTYTKRISMREPFGTTQQSHPIPNPSQCVKQSRPCCSPATTHSAPQEGRKVGTQ